MSVFIITQNVYITSFAEEDKFSYQENGLPYDVLLDADFNNNTGNGAGVAVMKYVEHDEEHGKSITLETNPNTWPEINMSFNEPISNGVLYVGYDVLRTTALGSTFDEFNGSANAVWANGVYRGFFFIGSNNTLGLIKDCDTKNWGHVAPSYVGSPSVDSWHRLETWVDLDYKKATFFVDGELVGEQTIADELNKIFRYRHGGEATNGYTTEYLDNFKIIHYPIKGKPITYSDILGIPEYFEKPALLTIKSDVLAHNYFERDNTIYVDVQNNTKEKITGTLNFNIVDEDGNEIFNEYINTSVDVSQVNSLAFNVTLDKYGEYYAEANFVADGYEIQSNAEEKLVRMVKNTTPNPKSGVSSHNYWGYGFDEIERKYQVFRDAGMSYTRETAFWVYYERNKNEYKFDQIMLDINEASRKTGLEQFLIIAADACKWGGSVAVPNTDETIKNFGDFTYNYVKDMNSETKYYEIFNETGAAPETIVKNYKTVYENAKKADPNCVVIGGASARVPLKWTEGVLQAGGGDYVDAWSCHPYTAETIPEKNASYGTSEQQIQSLRELLDKYGYTDMPIILSELSYSSANGYATEEQQAQFGIRQMIMVEPYIDLHIWYNDIEKGSNDGALEDCFGLMRYWNDTKNLPYQAKPALIAISAFNDLIGGAESLGKQESSSDDIYIYKYKEKGGKDVIAYWCYDDDKQRSISIDLGAEKAEIMDLYGNRKPIYADDGVFNVYCDGSVRYLIGNFTKLEQGESNYSVLENEIDIISGESKILKLAGCGDYDVDVEHPNNISFEVLNKNEIKINGTGSSNTKSNIVVNFVKNKRVVYSQKIKINYIDSVEYSMKLYPYNTKRIQAEIKLTNKRSVASGIKLTLTEPTHLAGKTYTINKITPHDTRSIRINIPIEDADTNKITIAGNLEAFNNNRVDTMPLSITKEVGFLKYGNKKPTIDGKITDGEWYTFMPIKINKKEMAQMKSWGGEDDLSANIYTQCDDENFYLGAEVTDDVYYDVTDPAQIWGVDSIQFAMGVERKNGSPTAEYGFGLANGEETLQCYIAQNVDGKIGTLDEGVNENCKVAVKRYEEEKKTVYELQIPWDLIYASGLDISKTKNIYFAVLVNDHDNNAAGRGWLEYCGGIGNSKNPEQFMELPVYKVQ